MRVQLRETGSILVPAAKREILDLLQTTVLPDARLVGDDRLETVGSTYVLRDSPAGTRVIHARSGVAPVPRATRERETLRRAVESDLYWLQSHFESRMRSGR